MKLTSENVQNIIKDCLFKEGENRDQAVIAEAVVTTFGFHPERLQTHKRDIADMLSELPDEFRSDKGGGWSFLNACMTKDGEQWGEHPSIDALIALGVATKQAHILMPRNMWSMFPGGMPYFSVTVEGQ